MAMTVVTTVERTTVAISGTIITKTTATIVVITAVAGLIQMAIEVAAMAIMISAITSVDAICALASTREPMIEHPTKAITTWSMTLPTVHRV